MKGSFLLTMDRLRLSYATLPDYIFQRAVSRFLITLSYHATRERRPLIALQLALEAALKTPHLLACPWFQRRLISSLLRPLRSLPQRADSKIECSLVPHWTSPDPDLIQPSCPGIQAPRGPAQALGRYIAEAKLQLKTL